MTLIILFITWWLFGAIGVLLFQRLGYIAHRLQPKTSFGDMLRAFILGAFLGYATIIGIVCGFAEIAEKSDFWTKTRF